MATISRVLVANRGEIAVRIIKACQKLGIETVLAMSDADRDTLAARMADRAVCIGPAQPLESYLKVNTLIMTALSTGADAIHPGYGFLAEQPELGEACAKNGVIFIGPKPDTIRGMGDKLVARKTAISLGIPVIPGSALIADLVQGWSEAEKIGFPILLKAAAGGGGKGMKAVYKPEEMETVFMEASAEARAAFGDDRLFAERFIPNARHIEVQILSDGSGNCIHLFERDCSLQRRYQKVIEEAPSIAVSNGLRKQMCEAAIHIAKSIGYENAGTVEFVLDQDEKCFYFLEMNTRIQVEHPVTEMVADVDLVAEQIRIAAGERLQFNQDRIQVTGHAIECRINAECPDDNFRPSPGRIRKWEVPRGEGIRVDTHCFEGYFVPPYYDSLLAKLIVIGKDREEAITKMAQALANFHVAGIDTNIEFLSAIVVHPHFKSGQTNTRWLETIICNKENATHE
ncbi:MAG: acetyl-CoA carboxylase biotin carboxylase subunit [Deltaproteobacteria bacterium]|jgi:acetyl-CoA carboxylase biotin carboxylase subunit|nr:acetyl-CoA carboxylase biotin carboxylase subunit [Deltaproteobacteria bacterium]MBW2202820.1 acetyl-CoA carboxylase biotin carboxylase subunit [Deltaproteobacteria bacterium]